MIEWFDLPQLTSFTTGDHSFEYTRYLSLSSMMIDKWLIELIFLHSLHSLQDNDLSTKRVVWAYQVWCLMIEWFDLPKLTTFTTEYRSFYETTSLSLSSMIYDWLIDLIFLNSLHSLQGKHHSIWQQVWLYQVWWMMCIWFDLPIFTSFISGRNSFPSVRSLSLSSLMMYEWLIWFSSTYHIHYRRRLISYNKFEYGECDAI